MKLPFAALAALVLTFAAFPVSAKEEEKAPPAQSLEELDKRVAKILNEGKIQGTSLTVIENNQIVFTKAYGYADVKAKKPVTPETVFRAGSISKSFTSIAVMMLVEEGKVALDAKLADLMPELKFTNKWEQSDPVRLVHLLEHTSGFDDIRFHHYLLTGKDVPLSEAVNKYGPYESRWKPGTRMSYSNAGPVIAGRIIEKVSGKTYPEFFAERLSGPLGMESAFFTLEPHIKDRISKSYADEQGKEEPFMEILARPSGSLNITSKDLAKLPLLMLGRGTLDGKTYLQQASVERIERPETTVGAQAGLHYGYGLGNIISGGRKTGFYGHDGGIDGFAAKYEYAPAIGAGFVIMFNRGDAASQTVADEIRSYLERNAVETKPQSVPLSEDAKAKIAGIYMNMTPRQQNLAFLTSFFAWTEVKFEDGKILYNAVKRTHVGNNQFQREDRALPNMIFVETPEQMELYTPTGADRKMPMWEIGWKLGYGAAAALAIALSALYMLIWIPSAFLGRLTERGGITIRLLPWAALLSVLGTAVTAIVLASGSDLNTLGKPSPLGWTLYAVTLAVPALGAISAIRSFIGAPDANFLVRFIAWLNSGVVLGFAAYMYAYGWIGLKIWE